MSDPRRAAGTSLLGAQGKDRITRLGSSGRTASPGRFVCPNTETSSIVTKLIPQPKPHLFVGNALEELDQAGCE
jgi:hypothetical protein